jgi:hypothetical protein
MNGIDELLTNVNVKKPNSISNNVNVKQVTDVQQIAHKLVDKLADPLSYEFFCSVAWHLPESVIWYNLEQAEKGRSPKKLFTWLCNQSMRKA